MPSKKAWASSGCPSSRTTLTTSSATWAVVRIVPSASARRKCTTPSANSRAYRLLGEYAGRILKGTKPSELPIQQPTTFDFVINMNTAKGLGIEVSPLMQLRAHAVIE